MGVSNWAGGSTREWRRRRALVLDRDGHRCRVKIANVCTTRATHVHHTIGRGVTGDDPAHMVASCEACNLHVGDPTGTDPEPSPGSWW